MSLYQCESCGCCENTAVGFYHGRDVKLCSACAPTHFEDGSPTNLGKWHGLFERVFLPKGMFRTAKNGNLEHIDTGDQDYRKYAIRVNEGSA